MTCSADKKMTNFFEDILTERTQFGDATYGMIGRALAYATDFESICRALSSIQHIKSRIIEKQKEVDEEADPFSEAVSEVWDLRLRRHVKNIVEYQEYTGEISKDLHAAKSSRNHVAHELALGSSHWIQSDKGRKELVSSLEEHIRCISKGVVIAELTTLIETNEPIPTVSYLDQYVDEVVKWIVEE